MANKISHHFKLAPDVADQLTKMAEFYTNATREDDFMIPGKITKTDIIESLIRDKFKKLIDEGFEV